MKKIQSVLISCFDKSKLDGLIHYLGNQKVTIYSTGGTAAYLKEKNIKHTLVEDLTGYPSILGGRVKTLHPVLMGGILSRHTDDDKLEMQKHRIPSIDLVVVDLYPFAETTQSTKDETSIIEKIDIGGVSLIRAAAKNYAECAVLYSSNQHEAFIQLLQTQNLSTTIVQRKMLAGEAFKYVAQYDNHIAHYFDSSFLFAPAATSSYTPRYGENPHQASTFYGELSSLFTQLQGKEISYNNLLDIHAAFFVLKDLRHEQDTFWGIIKHNNLCGAALSADAGEAWKKALASDPESAFGGILFTTKKVGHTTAESINTIFFEIVLAPDFDEEALTILKTKKNRILLKYHRLPECNQQALTVLDGLLTQEYDTKNYNLWNEVGGRQATDSEKQDLMFANLICKHLKSNAIAIVQDRAILGKGCGQTSRIDAVKQALAKAKQFNNATQGSVLASDAFFPFSDCVELAHQAGVAAFIQPGGSIRDEDSIRYCKDNHLAMVLTEVRHFKH